MRLIKNSSLLILIIGYTFAGVNHFRNPASYYPIIPHYLPYPVLINILAGVFEIGFAMMLISHKTRLWAVYGIIVMLAVFLPFHIGMVADAPFKLDNITITPFIAWARLTLQPVLMLWVGWHTKTSLN